MWLKALYQHQSDHFVPKSKARLLETADILAWEWAKHRERIAIGRHMRPSLEALLDVKAGVMGPLDFASKTHRAMHLTGAPLEHYFEQAKQLVLS